MHLHNGLRRLTETRAALQEMSASLSSKGEELARKEAEANAKLQEMVCNQQEAEKQKGATAELKIKVQASQKEIGERQQHVEAELAEVEPLVVAARQAVQGIKKAQLDEVRSMLNPPAAVKLAMEAVCTMLYDVKKPSWDDIRKNIRKDDFVSGILNFDTEVFKSDSGKMKAMRAFVDDPDFSYEKINKSSKACGPLVQWASAQYKFASILGSIQPLRLEVASLQEAGRAAEEELATLTARAHELEVKIEGYKKDYAELISQVQALKSEMSNVTAKVERSSQLLEDLMGERERWQRQTEAFGGDLASLVGNVMLSSALLVYMGMFDQETRAALLSKLRSHLAACRIRAKDDLSLADYLCAADERYACVSWRGGGGIRVCVLGQ